MPLLLLPSCSCSSVFYFEPSDVNGGWVLALKFTKVVDCIWVVRMAVLGIAVSWSVVKGDAWSSVRLRGAFLAISVPAITKERHDDDQSHTGHDGYDDACYGPSTGSCSTQENISTLTVIYLSAFCLWQHCVTYVLAKILKLSTITLYRFMRNLRFKSKTKNKYISPAS